MDMATMNHVVTLLTSPHPGLVLTPPEDCNINELLSSDGLDVWFAHPVEVEFDGHTYLGCTVVVFLALEDHDRLYVMNYEGKIVTSVVV